MPKKTEAELRDWFAGQALAAAHEAWATTDMANQLPDAYSAWFPASKMAERAYELADAMMDVREDYAD